MTSEPPWKLKLSRGRERLEWVVEELQAWSLSDAVRIELREHKHAWEKAWWLVVEEPPDPMLGVALGEWAHALRSLLDNMAWSIHVTQGGEPGESARLATFPMLFNAGKWIPRVVGPKLRYASAEQRQLIWDRQPFGQDTPDRRHMALLQDLNNTDKHESLHVASTAGMWVVATHQTFESLPGYEQFIETGASHFAVDEPGEHELGAVFVAHPADMTNLLPRSVRVEMGDFPQPEVNYGFQTTRQIVGLDQLTSIHNTVVDLVNDLSQVSDVADLWAGPEV